MEWLAFTWAVLATVLIFGLIGAPLAKVIGLRGFWIVAAAPAFAVTIIGGTAVVAPWLGLSWSLLPVLIVTAVVGGLFAALRFATRQRFAPASRPRRRFDAWLLVGLVVAAVLISARIAVILGDPESISQTFDDIFHLNGVRFILDTGNASSLWIGRMTNPGGSLAFYPAAWHGIVALVVQVSGVPIPVAVNAMTMAVSAIVWPLSIVLLTRTLFGRSRVMVVAAGLLAASLPVFPVLLLDYGVLYPYQLGIALVPVALAATIEALGLGRSIASRGRLWWSVALLGTLPGLVLAHPSAFVAWLAFTMPLAVVFVVSRWRASRRAAERWVIVGAFAGYLVVGLLLIRELRPPLDARLWPVSMSVWDAITDVVTISAWYHVPALLASAAVLAGIIWAVVSRSASSLVAVGLYLVAGLLFVTVAAGPLPQLRDALTGPWYNNLPRLAALLPIALVPLGAYGAGATWSWLVRRRAVHDIIVAWPGWLRATTGVLIAFAAAAGLQAGGITPVPVAQQWASSLFFEGPDSVLLSEDERALIERLDEHVPEGVAIAGSAWTGASLAYALADRPVLMPHTLMEITDDLQTINNGLTAARAGDSVCDAVQALNVGFVLDFGSREVHGERHTLPGLSDLAHSDAVRLVDQEGSARLYEVVACKR